MAEHDPNKLTAELIVAASKMVLETAAAPVTAKLRRTLQSVTNAYGPFLERTFVRVSTLKTFLKPNEPVDLLSNFVPMTVKLDEEEHDETDIISRLTGNVRVVLSALAGRGKSVLMRYIALSLYHNPQGRIPLFMELRALNGITSKNILGWLHSTYQGAGSVQFSDFVESLRSGLFMLILDGFDEVDYDARYEVEADILKIAFDFPKCPIVVSGRPDDRFHSWEKFTTFHVAAMTLPQVRQLISQASYDTEVTKAFLKRLTSDFYTEHESFLSTPLLAILLMLTFEQYAEIPRSLHTFYNNAFETLVRRHDAMKSQFLRKTYSQCSADDFRRVFSAFCIFTYSKSQFQFSRDEVLLALDFAAQKQGNTSKPVDLLADYIESICLLQVEGFEYSFVHRSFQEYFTAQFISGAAGDVLAKYLDSGRARIYDNVLPMLFEMAKDRVESEWVIGFVSNLLDSLDLEDDPSVRLMVEAYEAVVIGFISGKVILVHFDGTEMSRKIGTLRRFYPAYFVESGLRPANESPQEHKIAIDRITTMLEDISASGDKRFSSFASLVEESKSRKPGSPIPTLKIDLTLEDVDLLHKVEVYDYGQSVLQALREIKTDLVKKLATDQSFLTEVFLDN